MAIAVWIAGCSETDSTAVTGNITFNTDSTLYHLNGGTVKVRLTISNTTQNYVYYFTYDSDRFYGMRRTVINGNDSIAMDEFVGPGTNNSFLLVTDPSMYTKVPLAPAQQFSDELILTGSGTRVLKFFYGMTPATVNFSTFLERTITIQ